jgi:hypothetical protein
MSMEEAFLETLGIRLLPREPDYPAQRLYSSAVANADAHDTTTLVTKPRTNIPVDIEPVARSGSRFMVWNQLWPTLKRNCGATAAMSRQRTYPIPTTVATACANALEFTMVIPSRASG